MKALDRGQQIELLERLLTTPFESDEGGWAELLERRLRLPACFYNSVCKILGQGRWRNARHPFSYVKTAASREAVRMGLADREPQEIRVSDLKGYHSELGEPLCGNALEEAVREETDAEAWEEDERDERSRAFTPSGGINWNRVATLAELDGDERAVLLMRSKGLTREAILDSARTEEERLKLQASYRRLDRKKTRLQEAVLQFEAERPRLAA